MAARTIILICVSSLLVQAIASQCIRNTLIEVPYGGCGGLQHGNNPGLAIGNAGLALGNGCNTGNYGSLGNYASLGNFASLNGGELLVSSSSPLSPSGLSVVSENALEGALNVAGMLPFLSAVSLEGQVPSGGSSGVYYSCGNGNVGILGANEGYGASLANVGLTSGLGYGSGLGNVGLANVGIGDCGCNQGLNDGIVTIGTGCGGLYF